MRGFTFLVLAAVAGIGFTATTPKAEAQVGIDIGVAPECPMATMTLSLMTVLPLATMAQNGLMGTPFAGPWFHGSSDFQGDVNNRLHPDHGYKGPTPKRGEKAEPSKQVDSAHSKEMKLGMDEGTYRRVRNREAGRSAPERFRHRKGVLVFGRRSSKSFSVDSTLTARGRTRSAG